MTVATMGWPIHFLVGAPPPRPRRIGAESELADGGISPRALRRGVIASSSPLARVARRGPGVGVFAGTRRSILSAIRRMCSEAPLDDLESAVLVGWKALTCRRSRLDFCLLFLVGAPPPRPRRIGAESELPDEGVTPRAQCGAESLRVVPPCALCARGPGGRRVRRRASLDNERDSQDVLRSVCRILQLPLDVLEKNLQGGRFATAFLRAN